MSIQSSSQSTNSRAELRVQEALDRMHLTRAEFRRAAQVHSIDEKLHLQMQHSILDVYDELHPYRDHVSTQWGNATPFEDGLDAIPQLAAQYRTESSVTFQNGVPSRNTELIPHLIDVQALLETSRDLDAIAAELGFGSNVSSRPGANYSETK